MCDACEHLGSAGQIRFGQALSRHLLRSVVPKILHRRPSPPRRNKPKRPRQTRPKKRRRMRQKTRPPTSRVLTRPPHRVTRPNPQRRRTLPIPRLPNRPLPEQPTPPRPLLPTRLLPRLPQRLRLRLPQRRQRRKPRRLRLLNRQNNPRKRSPCGCNRRESIRPVNKARSKRLSCPKRSFIATMIIRTSLSRPQVRPESPIPKRRFARTDSACRPIGP